MFTDLKVSLPTNFGVATYPPGASFGPRLMQDWEFVWLIQGDAEYRWRDSIVAAAEGSVVLCRPGATDFFQWDRNRRTRHAFFHFQMVPPDGWQDWPLVREPEDDDILHPLFRYVLTWAGQGDPEPCLQAIAAMLAVFHTGNRAAGHVTPGGWPQAVEQAWKYIFEKLDEDPAHTLPLTELAGIACVTPEHLCRLFKSSVGYSPAETVRLARLDRAATLLARSNYAVGEVAAFCGFASPYHFSRLFHSVYGLSPTEFRRRVQAGETPPLPPLLRVSRSF
jgi:AraC family transcriptional regulator